MTWEGRKSWPALHHQRQPHELLGGISEEGGGREGGREAEEGGRKEGERQNEVKGKGGSKGGLSE